MSMDYIRRAYGVPAKRGALVQFTSAPRAVRGRIVGSYLYHDAATAEQANPLTHSTLLVLADGRRPTFRNETPLLTLAQAESLVAAERERWEAVVFDGWRVLAGLDEQAAKRTTHQNVSDTLDALMRVLREPNSTVSRNWTEYGRPRTEG